MSFHCMFMDGEWKQKPLNMHASGKKISKHLELEGSKKVRERMDKSSNDDTNMKCVYTCQI